ncbi:Hypothetical protein ADU71_0616 [Pediococcus damnosus]|nr:Hypothetical protein ADU69_0611 [Pediococcus damnosus]AMV64532.1 Hypothetical protein ADU71_0616 [Pediococcus damnosus]AMV69607.1 Hypothetical protein ADU73_1209 [Pediococcus damnosus]
MVPKKIEIFSSELFLFIPEVLQKNKDNFKKIQAKWYNSKHRVVKAI